MEIYTKMAGLSAKNIPYGIHGIHMELASIPPGIHLECGGTVKTSSFWGCGSKHCKKLVPNECRDVCQLDALYRSDCVTWKVQTGSILQTLHEACQASQTLFSTRDFGGNVESD